MTTNCESLVCVNSFIAHLQLIYSDSVVKLLKQEAQLMHMLAEEQLETKLVT